MRTLRTAFTGILIMMLIAEPAMAQTMTVSEGFNLRLTAGMDGTIHHQAAREEQVEVVERGNEWALVQFSNGKRYWIHSSGLKEYNPDVASGNAGNIPANQTFKATQDHWPIRSRAGTKTAGSMVVDYVSSDTPLVLLGTEKDGDGDTWYKVKYNDNGKELVGYIYEGRVRAMSDSETEACATCATGATGNTLIGFLTGTNAEEIAAVTANDAKGYHLGNNYDKRCNSFITENGLGEWGRHMVAAAQKIAPGCFYNDNVFDNVCPGYRNMSKERKNTFIALLFASIAQVESTCRPWAQVQGENDIADGLFQLEYSKRVRKAAGRNSRWCKTNEAVDTQSLTFQSECAVSIVEDTVCAWNGFINHPDGYWQKLRNNRRITSILQNEIARWKLCN